VSGGELGEEGITETTRKYVYRELRLLKQGGRRKGDVLFAELFYWRQRVEPA